MLFLCVPLMSSGLCRKYILCRSYHSYYDSLTPSGPVSVFHRVQLYCVCGGHQILIFQGRTLGFGEVT